MLPCCYISHFFWLFQPCVLLRSSGQSGSEETALVIIHLSIFSHALLHYSHPSICTAIHVCHSNELRLASPVITTWAVLPFPTAFSALYWEKFPADVIFKSLTAMSLFIFFSHINRWVMRKHKGNEIKTMNKKSFVCVLTYGSAVEHHLLKVASIIVDSEVPGPRVHVLNETRFLEAAQQQAFGGFGSWDGISQGPGQRLPIQQFHKVELDKDTKQQYRPVWWCTNCISRMNIYKRVLLLGVVVVCKGASGILLENPLHTYSQGMVLDVDIRCKFWSKYSGGKK